MTATSVISSSILRIAANPVFRRVHLRAYTLAAALAITFLATLVSVAVNTRDFKIQRRDDNENVA